MRRGERAENESGIELQEYSDRLGSSERSSSISDFRFDLGSIILPVDGLREQLATDPLEPSSFINNLNSFIASQINKDQGAPGYSPLLDRIRPLDYPKVRVEFDPANRLFVPIPRKIFKAPKEENLRGLPADVWMIIAGFVLESSVEDAYSFASTCRVFYNLVAAEPNFRRQFFTYNDDLRHAMEQASLFQPSSASGGGGGFTMPGSRRY